ncbi:unnamed protein product [Candida verbasci]|uniref:STAS domain-containing protein n=1 Tax=Candida verbasci TaxID=1227364 RepID=A0A9W4XKW1_9ASCO|nr:unnamed protein product [Candida verbasci]
MTDNNKVNSPIPEHRNRFKISSPVNENRSGRFASPSPSIRVISNRRVHNERSTLLDKSTNSQDSNTYIPDDNSIIVKDTEYYPTNTNSVENLTWSEILPYYLPCLSWIKHYNLQFFIGDLIGGLTLVFFQLPLSLSYATTLAHVPVISGLYSLGISPLIYGVFGSCPQLIVGPESPISMVVGQAVEPLLHHAKKKQLDPLEYVVAITFVSGATLLGFGLGRFGFLDNVLSGSLLKGFISAVGIVMIINALVVTLGLEGLMKEISDDPSQMDIHSPFDKLRFLLSYFTQYDTLTLRISLVGFLIIMGIRIFKKMSKKSYAVFIPEILLVVAGSTILCEYYRWDLEGIEIIGKIKNHNEFKLYNPISLNSWHLIKKLSSSGLLCAMLGFFESTTASKSLGSRYDLPISSNRELIALGSINIIGSLFGALPAFGGYGRSKVNAISAKTTMSGVIMGIFTLLAIAFFLKYLYFVPQCMLSVVTAVIGISLIEEAPYEVYFHWKAKGYEELITFGITVFFTLTFSMEHGVFLGLIYSLIRVIKNSAESRIQILGRYPNTNTFIDADIPTTTPDNLEKSVHLNLFNDSQQRQINKNVIEEVEGCLIIKIPEPLTFTNSSDLNARLKRVELYGSTKAHPASKRSRDKTMNKYIIFDLKGMTVIDSSALRILKDVITGYRNRFIKTLFVRVSNEQVVEKLRQAKIIELLIQDLSDLKYFSMQQIAENNDNVDQGILSCYNLIEDIYNKPFFNRISDALKVIDCYETSLLLDV